MGQKVHPYGFRLGITKPWLSRWFASKRSDFVDSLVEDIQIRKFIRNRFKYQDLSKIEITRYPDRIALVLYTARPGTVIGRKGENIAALQNELSRMTNKKVHVYVKEVRTPEIDAQIVADNIAKNIENRVSYKRVIRQAIQNAMKNGALGIKVRVSGRLAGAEIARSEEFKQGRIPLSTLRADIDYGFSEAITKVGVIGVKVWIYKGDVNIK